MKVRALILAAGFGKRLGDLTKDCPKPLVRIGEARLIELGLWHLSKAGFTEITINLHYLGQKIADFLGDGSRYKMQISYSWEDPILDTGGAIKKVFAENPNNPILIFNCDAVFGKDFNLKKFIADFLNHKDRPIAAMVLRNPPKDNQFGIVKAIAYEEVLRITQILETKLSPLLKEKSQDYIFAGVHIFSKEIASYFHNLPEIFCSMKNLYPKLLEDNKIITGHLFNGYWNDTGTPERLEDAKKAIDRNELSWKG